QTIEDCLTEAMDIDGLEALLRRIENNEVRCVARELPEPSPLAHEILNARPYAFLDNAPLEERRTQAVLTRRASDSAGQNELGVLDAAAIDRVCAEAWPDARNADELHEALLLLGAMTDEETARCSPEAASFLKTLVLEKRAGRLAGEPSFWVAAERLPMVKAVYPESRVEPYVEAPAPESKRIWEREEALRELVRGRMEAIGPVTCQALEETFALRKPEIQTALLGLESEGFILRGRFHPGAETIEWCDRRLLARIHRLTLNRLRAEIQPVSLENFQRFLVAWQRADKEHRTEGPTGVETVLDLLDGMELPAGAWEPEVLALRVKDYSPQWLDQLCLTGRVGWGRLSPAHNPNPRALNPLRSTPISVYNREHLGEWLELSSQPPADGFAPDTEQVLQTLAGSGAMFFGEIVRATKLLPSRVAQALGELAAKGWATADSFEGLRALLVPSEKRAPLADTQRKRHYKTVTSIEFAGRWSLLRKYPSDKQEKAGAGDEAIEKFARTLLLRYGVVFRRLLERESLGVSWYELGRVYRRLEARGEIRGGHFVNGVSGEQFALPEAIGLMRSVRKAGPTGELVVINAADPLNLSGILTPGPRVASITANRILMRDGLPLAALIAGEIKVFDLGGLEPGVIQQALIVGKMSPELRRYYG
ncbi:MAG TPA: ATP-dependent DNA helicase, partial [Verrucomicrobiae bacterium]|nr:ATP-dependent DNA helicase [Verrucomicrobiae bacterium]